MAKPISIKNGKDNLWSLALLLPILIPLIIFWIYPMIKTFHISFTNWDYISPTYDYVMLENYKNIMGDSFFVKVLMNTLVFTVFTVLPPILIGLLVAIPLSKIKAFRTFFVASAFSSWITPTVVVSMVWVSIFDTDSGIVNAIKRDIRCRASLSGWEVKPLHMRSMSCITEKISLINTILIIMLWKASRN
ncbi:Diacetylchitobiose uptake system permease protein NgcF [Lysinibacillus sphaericus]